MTPALKNILAAGMLLFLGFHFTLVLNYAAPVQAGQKINAASSLYCYPYFHQKWTVFVPAPDVQLNLYMRAGKDGDWQPWFSLSEELMLRNKKKPPSGAEQEALLVSNALYYLYADLGDTNRIYPVRPAWPSFSVADQAARNYFHSSARSRKEKEYELLLMAKRQGKTTAYYFKHLSPL